MKLLILIVVFMSTGYCSYNPKVQQALRNLKQIPEIARATEDPEINNFLLASVINNTLVSLSESLAELDPYHLAGKTNFNISQSSIRLDAVLEDVYIGGFSNFVATQLSLSLLTMRMTFTISLPKITALGGYDGAGSVIFIPLYGTGDFNTEVSDIIIHGNATVALTNPINIRSLSLGYHLGNIQVGLTGLIANEDFSKLVSELLSDILADLLNAGSQLISGYLSTAVQDILNDMLASL